MEPLQTDSSTPSYDLGKKHRVNDFPSFKLVRDQDGGSKGFIGECSDANFIAKNFQTAKEVRQAKDAAAFTLKDASNLPESASDARTLVARSSAYSCFHSGGSTAVGLLDQQDGDQPCAPVAQTHTISADQLLHGIGAQFDCESCPVLPMDAILQELQVDDETPIIQSTETLWSWPLPHFREIFDKVLRKFVRTVGGEEPNSTKACSTPARNSKCANSSQARVNKRKRDHASGDADDSRSISSCGSKKDPEDVLVEMLADRLKPLFVCPLSRPEAREFRCLDRTKHTIVRLTSHTEKKHLDLVPEDDWGQTKSQGTHLTDICKYFRVKYKLYAAIKRRWEADPARHTEAEAFPGGSLDLEMDAEYRDWKATFAATYRHEIDQLLYEDKQLVTAMSNVWDRQQQELDTNAPHPLQSSGQASITTRPEWLEHPDTGPSHTAFGGTTPVTSTYKPFSGFQDSGYDTGSAINSSIQPHRNEEAAIDPSLLSWGYSYDDNLDTWSPVGLQQSPPALPLEHDQHCLDPSILRAPWP